MKPQIIKKKIKQTGKQKLPPSSKNIAPAIIEGELKSIAVADIEFSPFNYRKFYSQVALENFASELAQHGIISPLTLRKIPSGRYELVAGERRLRAAKIAKLKEVPAVIKILTDDEVVEIQLAENLQREDPHPMHEAQAIGRMKEKGMSIDEIATRLGKSKQFVYNRLKLLSLTDSFQEMFLADIITIQDALEIATVSTESQVEFYEEYCTNWKKQKNFTLHNLDYYLNQFKCDLKKAPFNTKDKKLLAEAGPCTTCPSNTATLKTLFPEYAKQCVCTNKECFQKKCTAHFLIGFRTAFEEQQPQALLFNGKPSPMIESILSLMQDADDLPKYDCHEVTVLSKPELPDKGDYTNEWNEDEPEFDEDGFNQAMDEYYSDLENYNLQLKSEKYQKAILVGNKEFQLLLFSNERPLSIHSNSSNVTGKMIQEAIKAGKATPELLEAEIDRITNKEKRAKELDREKIQIKVHETFSEQIREVNNNTELTAADLVAARLLIYQSLDYTTRNLVNAALFPVEYEKEKFYDLLVNLTDQQHSYLIRMAVAGKSESKYATNITAYFLYKTAKDAGIDIAGIEQEQEQKATDRQNKQKERIEELKKRIKKLKPAA